MSVLHRRWVGMHRGGGMLQRRAPGFGSMKPRRFPNPSRAEALFVMDRDQGSGRFPCRNNRAIEECPPAGVSLHMPRRTNNGGKDTRHLTLFGTTQGAKKHGRTICAKSSIHLYRITRRASMSPASAFYASLTNHVARFSNPNTGDLRIPKVRREYIILVHR